MNGDVLIPFAAIVSPMAMVAWIVYVIVDGRRRRERMKATAEFHSKLLERLGSMKEFGEFLETEGGRQFMTSVAADSPKAAGTHIVRSAETGVICLSVGVGILLLRSPFPEIGGGFTIIGTILVSCGIGFLLSGAASYRLSKAFGLMNGQKPSLNSAGELR